MGGFFAQGRCATRLRYAPTLTILVYRRFSPLARVLRFPGENCRRTVPRLRFVIPPVPEPTDSLAVRLSFCSASRFICNFI